MAAIWYLLLYIAGGVAMVRLLLPRKSPLVRAWLGTALGVLLMMQLPALCAYFLRSSLAAHAAARVLLAAALVPSMAEGADAVSSASVADFYGAAALTGDELMDAINSTSGFYLVSTTNPDGTPNSAYFIFAMRKNEDKYYLQLGLAENQSKQNLAANGEGLAVYADTPSSEEGAKPYAVSGARIRFKAVTDEDLLKVLNPEGREGSLFFEVTEVRPLG